MFHTTNEWSRYFSILSVFILFFFTIVATGCGSGNETSPQSDGSITQFLAKNVIFDMKAIRTAQAQEYILDTETKVFAKNVVFENTYLSHINSENVQDALEEISLILTEIMVGTWTIQNYHQEEYHFDTGKIKIYNDGTFDLIEGSFAAIGMGAGSDDDPLMCDHIKGGSFWESYVDDIVAFSHDIGNHIRVAIPRLVKLRQNEIIFIGQGGCGILSGHERISVLTREAL